MLLLLFVLCMRECLKTGCPSKYANPVSRNSRVESVLGVLPRALQYGGVFKADSYLREGNKESCRAVVVTVVKAVVVLPCT